VFSSDSSNSRCVKIIFNGNVEYTIHKQIQDRNGNYIILDMTIQNRRLTLIGLYGPNKDDPDFFENIKTQIRILGNLTIIMAGDWNVPFSYELDTANYLQKNYKNAQSKLLDIIEELDLNDIWRSKNPERKRYTWFGPNHKRSRLDYFLISDDPEPLVKHVDMLVKYKSDHTPISLSVLFNNQPRGRGTWTFNNSRLSDPTYVQIVKQTIDETIHQYKQEDSDDLDNIVLSVNDQLFWDMIKLNIRGKTITYTAMKKRDTLQREHELELELKVLLDSNQIRDTSPQKADIDKTETELKTIREDRIQGLNIRAKAKWHAEGKKYSLLLSPGK
jgi:hypothetical protein